MNIAFPAALVAAIILPGLIARYTYARGSWGWSSATSMRSIVDEFTLGLIFSIGLHALWLSIATHIKAVDVGATIALLNGAFGKDLADSQKIIRPLSDNYLFVASYFLTLYAFSGLAGNWLHSAVRNLRLDHRTKLFRFSNHWYYILKGEFDSLDQAEPIPVSGVYLSTVVDHSGKSYLYGGIVWDFTFDKAGALDTIILIGAERRLLENDRKNGKDLSSTIDDERFYEIRGDYFVVKYSEARTLNVDYFTIEAADEGTHEPADEQTDLAS